MANDCKEIYDIIRSGISIVIPALAGVGGVFLGAYLSEKRDIKQRKYLFIERQLREFYSPLLGLRTEIQMRGEVRGKISAEAERAWRQLCDEASATGNVEASIKLTNERSKEFEDIIKYDNRVLKEDLIPAYRQMVMIFRENMWLVEPSTKLYFKELMEFVDIWDRYLNRSLPVEVLRALEHDEKKLNPFYKNLDETINRLRSKLESGDI